MNQQLKVREKIFTMIVAGVMTGTSVDGIDVALVEFKTETDWKLIDAKEKSFVF